MSDTPRTDKECSQGCCTHGYAAGDFTRILERELTDATKRIEELEKEQRTYFHVYEALEKVSALQCENERLKGYSRHSSSCFTTEANKMTCTCGLSALLNTTPENEK